MYEHQIMRCKSACKASTEAHHIKIRQPLTNGAINIKQMVAALQIASW
jgi:hypothetical protein